MPDLTLQNLISEIEKSANPARAEISLRFFKTGKGQYGEGDKFLGISVPVQRRILRNYVHLDFFDLEKLLKSDIHEYRFISLQILVSKFKRANQNEKERKKIFNFYIKNRRRVNNWDLVDTSAPNIVGEYLKDKDKALLYKLAKSKNLWDRRIAIISTLTFIRNNSFEDTFKISKMLLGDKHDLIHKAVGWMLRTVGDKSFPDEKHFLDTHLKNIPRTALRYAIEKFPPAGREFYLKR